MLFYLIGIVFTFIFIIALFGNNNARELEKDALKWKEIMKEDYYV